jgi:hypothetical protein
MAIKVLLQTTIVPTADDWSIARFQLLSSFLSLQKDATGKPAFEVTARDRESADIDPILSTLQRSDFDEMWLFAVDTGHGLTTAECASISEFRRSGRGLLVTRDHMDLGSSVCNLEGVGLAHQFHTKNLDTRSPLVRDDPDTLNIDWPNFHSGANGDFQQVEVAGDIHPVLVDATSPTARYAFYRVTRTRAQSGFRKGSVRGSLPPGTARPRDGASISPSHLKRPVGRAGRLPRAASITLSTTTGIRGGAVPASWTSPREMRSCGIARHWLQPIPTSGMLPPGWVRGNSARDAAGSA